MRKIFPATTAIALAVSGAAYGQAAVAPSAVGPASSSTPVSQPSPSNELPEIIVTAQRRSENVQKAAVAISVLSGADLANAGVTQVDRLSSFAPALTVEPTANGNIMFVRGVGNFTVLPTSDPAVAFNYDGVYVGRPTSTSGVFYDLDRVEILKGPQGTLYGRNATGGAINVLPQQPKLGEFSGYGSLTFGNYSTANFEGAVNVPLGNDAGLRISGSSANHNGYLKDGTSDDKTNALRVQAKAEFMPGFTARIAADYSHTGGNGSGISYYDVYTYNAARGQYDIRPSGVDVSEGVNSPASQAFRTTVRLNLAGRNLDPLTPYPYVKNDFYGSNAEINYDTPIGTLTVTPAWRYSSLDYLSDAGAFLILTREQDRQHSFEARLAGRGIGMFDYILGAYYFDETVKSVNQVDLSAQVAYNDVNLKTHSLAPFARLTAHLTDSLRLVGGIRYTNDRKSYNSSTDSANIICRLAACPTVPLAPLTANFASLPYVPLPAPGAVAPIGTSGAILSRSAPRLFDSRLKNGKTTYRAAIEYDLAPNSLLYASYETGFRSGGFASATGYETYKPEFLNAATVGWKNQWFNRRLQLNVEAFHWDYKDQQVNHVSLDQSTPPINANFTENIGKSRIEGVEVEARWLATQNTLLSTNVQYLDAKNLSFVYTAGNTGTPPLTGCKVSVAPNPALYNVDCSGFASYNSPRWTVNLAAQQTVEIAAYKLVFGADTQFKTARNIGFAYLPAQTLGAVWRSNAQVAFSEHDDRWSVAAYVRNIEDHRTAVYSSFHPLALITMAGTTPPRTYGMRLSAKFQ